MPEQAQHLVGGVGEVGAGAEDRLHAGGAEHGIILRPNDTDFGAAGFLESVGHLAFTLRFASPP